MTKDVASNFDKVFLGWGEPHLAKELGKPPGDLVHPDTYMHVTWKGIRVQSWGVLFTSRGCNKTCTFCQTPRFYRKPYALDLATIESVLKEYKRRNVAQVIVLDENFGHFEDYTDQVVDLLWHYRLKWNPMTRVETLRENYEKWRSRGLCGASIGLESLNQDSLNGAKKGNDRPERLEILKRMRKDNLLVQTFYIIGFEQDAEQSIRENILELKRYHVDAPQIQILTPQPETILFKQIQNDYGIITFDYSKYDTTHLVWNHPHVSPQRMRQLMFWANDVLFTPRNSLRTAWKIALQSAKNIARNRGMSAPVWAGDIDRMSVTPKELSRYGSRGRPIDVEGVISNEGFESPALKKT
jgi:radical SAM superfamily enzyme YgiQ (UPF0313 family)